MHVDTNASPSVAAASAWTDRLAYCPAGYIYCRDVATGSGPSKRLKDARRQLPRQITVAWCQLVRMYIKMNAITTPIALTSVGQKKLPTIPLASSVAAMWPRVQAQTKTNSYAQRQ